MKELRMNPGYILILLAIICFFVLLSDGDKYQIEKRTIKTSGKVLLVINGEEVWVKIDTIKATVDDDQLSYQK